MEIRLTFPLPYRIAAGALIFAILAYLDWRKRGPRATRWREYSFLFLCLVSALLYGVLNDQLTSRISWEYFYYGKGLADILPDQPIPHPRLSYEAAKLGLQATWSAGLLIGVALLIANNPRPNRPQLTYRTLIRKLILIFTVTAIIAIIMGLAGYLGLFTHFSTDFAEMQRTHEWRPRRFMLVFDIHLGGYLVALTCATIAVVSIRRQRRDAHSSPAPGIPGEGGGEGFSRNHVIT